MDTRRPRDRPLRSVPCGGADPSHPDPDRSPDARTGSAGPGRTAEGCRALPRRGSPHPDPAPGRTRGRRLLQSLLGGAAVGSRVTPLRRGDERPQEPVRAIVELPEPIRPAGYAEHAPYKLTWAGGVHLLGGGILVVPGRTLDTPEDARALAAAILAAASRMEDAR